MKLFRFSILYYNNVVGGRCWYFKVKFINIMNVSCYSVIFFIQNL